MILRPHQDRALVALRQSVITGHRRPMLAFPTGAGKTIIGAKAVIGARDKGNPTAFCVPSIGLVDQTAARFIANGIPADDIGIVQGDHAWRRDHARVQICTAQTLARRDLPKAAVVFVDEAHIRFSIYERWMTANPETVFIGMSATPWAKGLGRWYDDLIKPIGMQELIDKGYLSKFVAFAPPTVDLTGVHTVAGDFVEDELANLMNKPRLVADIVSTWLERGHGRPTLCFAVNRAHAKSIRDKFEQEGVRCAYVDAFTPREERDDIGVAMAEGVTQVTVNIGCLTTGTDWPHVSCIILARPTKSESLFVQIMGRGLRPIYPDGFDEAAATDEERAAALATMKDHCLFLDHSDTHTRLGMITDIDHNHLSLARASRNAADGKERDEVVLPRACQCCGSLVPPRSSKCPSCGHTNVAPNQVDQIDGELVELRGAGQRPAKKGHTVTEQLKSLGAQELKAQINSLRREMNWSNGRASHFYKDIMGVWPKGDWDYSIPYAEPCGILRSFDRHRRIAYATVMAAQKRV